MAAIIETWFNQDLMKPVQVHYLDGNLFSHNGGGNRIGVHVYNNGVPATLTGSVTGYVVTSDGSTVPCTGTRSGSDASILIPAAAYQPGTVFITIFISSGDTVTTLASVATSVLVARTSNQVSPGSVVSDWTDTINAAMQDVVDASVENIALPYASLTYPVPLGAYTIHDNLLYRCTTAIPSSEAWTSSHWTRARLADDVQADFSDLKSAIGQVKGEIFNDSINLFDKSKIETGLLNVVGNIATTQTTFRTTDFIPVDYPNSVVIQDDSKVSQDRYYICEYNASKEFIGSRQELLVGLNITYGVYTVAESNAKFIRISYMPQNTPTDTLMIFLGNSKSPTFQPFGALFVKDSFVSQVKTPIAVRIANEKLYVITKYKDGSDLCVGFGKHGGNNLPDFETLGLIQNNDFYPVTDASSSTPFITIATDIHAPYLVKAINNINGDLPNSEHFTGGNHNYNNNAAPGYTPTAICDSLKYYVDGNEVSEYTGYAKSVKAVWINSVQATNTKKADGTGRNVLKETHTLVFEDGKWHSSIEIVPLEDVLIKTYYGFQWFMNEVYPNIRFIGAVNRGLYTNSQVNTSGDNVVNAMRMFGSEHSAEIDLDTTFDIGNRRFYSGTSGAYNSTAKSYFYLMSNVNANAGNLYCVKADFIFSPIQNN